MLREKLYNEFVQSDDVNRIKARFEAFYEDVMDLNKKAILPLSEYETYIFRYQQSIVKNNVARSMETLKLSYGTARLQRINALIYSRIHCYKNDLDYCDKLSVFNSELYADKAGLKKTPIGELGFPTSIFETLRDKRIYTLEQLLSYNSLDLRRILVDRNPLENSYGFVERKIKELGLDFYDNLQTSIRKEIITSSNKEIVDNSSFMWLAISNENINILNSLRIETIGDLKKAINDEVIFDQTLIDSYNTMFDENFKVR